jgi:TonB family protein
VNLRPGPKETAPADAAKPEAAADEVPATVIMKPGASTAATLPPTPQPPGTERTVILKSEPSPDSTAKVTPAAPPGVEDVTAAVRPKTPAPPPEAVAPPPPPPPPPAADTSSTGPIPVVPPPAAKKKGNGLVIGVVVGGLLFLLLAIGGVIWAVKSYLSKQAASIIAAVPSEAPSAPVEETPAQPPTTEPAAPEPPATEETQPAPPPVQETTEVTQPPAPATVMITSDPPGARVIVGKKERGVTPYRTTLPPGKASISVEKDGYKPFRRDLRLASGKTETVEARLEAIPRETPPPPPPSTLPQVRTGDLVALTPDVTPPKKLSGESVRLRTSLPKKFNGSVTVEFIVDEEGKVRDPKVAESAGDPKIDGPCVDAVKTYRYEPATLRGVRVKVGQRAKFTFQSR